MAKYLIAPFIVLGFACIFVGVAIPTVCLKYSQGYAGIAVKVAREPERFDNPTSHNSAIAGSLDASNRLSGIIATSAVVCGVIAGAALISSASLLSKVTDLRRRLADARSQLESVIAAKCPDAREGEQDMDVNRPNAAQPHTKSPQ